MENNGCVRRPTPEELLLISICHKKVNIDYSLINNKVYLLFDGMRSLCELDLWKYDDTEIFLLPSA